MAEVIKPALALGLPSTWKTVVAKIGKGAANAPSNSTVLPAGYPVLLSTVSGQEYDAFTKTGIAAAIVDTKGTVGTSVTTVGAALGILLEPWTVSATQTDVKIAYAGEFNLEAIYAACEDFFDETEVTPKMLRNAHGHIIFAEHDVQAIYS